jgi:PhzF family phenazine biosynthesis protein
MPFPIHLVDVFATGSFSGNPLAVVFDADGLSEDQMRSFARWINFSETTFLLSPSNPQADYRVRIFTPGGELAFAGHPTLGSCHSWLKAGGAPKRSDEIIQECGVGLVRIQKTDADLAFVAPLLVSSPVDSELQGRILTALGLEPGQVRAWKTLDNGTTWIGLLLSNSEDVLALEPDQALLKQLPKIGVIAPRPAGEATDFEVRAFAACVGVPEDPVTGSLNASLAQWLMAEGFAADRYTVSQGARLGRSGLVRLEKRVNDVWVGGSSRTVSEGRVAF